MSKARLENQKQLINEEIPAKYKSGIAMLLLNIFLMLASAGLFVCGIIIRDTYHALGFIMLIAGLLYFSIIGPILFVGLKVLKPNEAYVLTLFGKYYGTLKGPGFFFVNPFATAFNPATPITSSGKLGSVDGASSATKITLGDAVVALNTYRSGRKKNIPQSHDP